MPRISTPSFYTTSINALLDQQAKVSNTQLKISTGKKILSPADDPISSSKLVNLKQQEAETEQFQRSAKNVIFELSSEEVQLDNMQTQLRKARELAILAGNASLTGTNLNTVKDEIQGVLEQMVDIANANIDGRYMFAGSKSVVKPIVKNSNNVYEYRGDELQGLAKIGPSINVVSSDTAKKLFFQLPTNDITVQQFSGQVSVTSTNPGLTAVSGLAVLNANDLKLNNITIDAAVSDGVSTTDQTASAIATATAINKTTSKHGIIAAANATVFDFTGGTYTAGTLAAGDLTINGVQITGAPAAATAQGLADLINGTSLTGVVASDNAGELRLTATDGRNIQLTTTGASASGINFGNFDITSGALDQVYRSTVTLTNHESITIAGSLPGDIGLTANVYNVTANSGTASISTPFVSTARPTTIASNENYFISFSSATQFSIYRESAPTTAVTGFQKFSAGQTIDDAVTIASDPVTYTTGDTIVIDGIQFTITGTPVANDNFTIDTEPVANRNLFLSMQNLITAIGSYGNDSPRLSYEIGLALDNITGAEDRVSEVRAQVGSRMTLTETQEDNNDEFIFFAKQAISEIEDLDVISAISTLVQQKLSLEAAYRSLIRIQELSLVNFI